MRLNLSVPQLHENFFATWRSEKPSQSDHMWSLEIPFLFDGKPIGTLNVTGRMEDEFASSCVSEFLDFVEPFESQLQSLIAIEQSKRSESETESVQSDAAVDSESKEPESAATPG